MIKTGRGRPLTLFAPGGQGENLAGRMTYADGVKGTKIGFVYEQSGHFESVATIRRQADRDAAEVRALAAEHKAVRAIGFSRGARAIVGALGAGPDLFERVALVIPPGNLRVKQNYEIWLESLSAADRRGLAADILVVGEHGDRVHPADVAQAWAEQLGARLELLPARTVRTDPARVIDLLAGYFN